MRMQDTIGLSLSGLCLVHCLAVPVLISIAPAVSWMGNELIHIGLANFALLVSLSAVRQWPGGLTGLMLTILAGLGVSLLFHGALSEMSEGVERITTSIGAAALAAAHILAWLNPTPRHRHPFP
ncbi:MAG: MerC domain-containing protein [Maricaulis sp.]|jgi:hypothetical protein|nr:MerC domain-containing protein [Maricaulis sp.]